MPRDIAGNYTLPAGNPVVPNTIISTNWANTTLDDVAQALTQSLSIDGSVTTAKIADDAVTPPKLNGQDVDGIVARISSTEFEGRTIAGTADQISVSNGDGVSGNPTVAIANSPRIPGPEVRILGSGTGAANNAYLSFYESNGTVRRGFVGDGTATNNIQLAAEMGDLELTASSNVTIAGTVAYRRGNILGGVGLSGGVPTGAIIETGTNANGRYVRYADGTMICTNAVVVTGPSIANGANFRSAPISWVYPSAFAALPSVSMFPVAGVGFEWCGFGDIGSGTTSANFVVLRSTNNASDSSIAQLAVGRWA